MTEYLHSWSGRVWYVGNYKPCSTRRLLEKLMQKFNKWQFF